MRGARGAGADARAQLCPLRRYFDAADYVSFNTIHYLVTNYAQLGGFGRIVTYVNVSAKICDNFAC